MACRARGLRTGAPACGAPAGPRAPPSAQGLEARGERRQSARKPVTFGATGSQRGRPAASCLS